MTPKMDKQLAVGQDFFDWLCLAKASPSGNADATFAVAPGNEVAVGGGRGMGWARKDMEVRNIFVLFMLLSVRF